MTAHEPTVTADYPQAAEAVTDDSYVPICAGYALGYGAFCHRCAGCRRELTEEG